MEGPKTVEELTVDYHQDGEQMTKELQKEVLSKGAWATVMFLYQDKDKKTGEFGPAKVRIQRYQKRNGIYQYKNKFNISSAAQAKKIVETLGDWLDNPEFKEGK